MAIMQTPWTSQPQQAVEIDWSNPITSGLVSVDVPLLDNKLVNVGGALTTPTKSGMAFKGNGSSSYYKKTLPITVDAKDPSTIFAVVEGVGATDSRAYAVACATGYFTQIGSSTSNAAKGRCVLRAPNKDIIIGDTTRTVFENGVPHAMVQRYTPGTLSAFVDGYPDISGSGTGNGNNGTLEVGIGALVRGGSGAGLSSAKVIIGAFWNRALSDAEIRSISQNPWQIFKPIPRRIFVPVSAVGGLYTLTANSGSYALSGKQVSLLKHRNLSSQTGAYSFSGKTASITYVPLAAVYTLTAQSGSYALAGLPTQLSKHRNLLAAFGSYNISGKNAQITYTALTPVYTITALSGAYSVSGKAASILMHRSLTASAGSYSYQGKSITISKYTPGSGTLVKYLNVLTGEVLILKPI